MNKSCALLLTVAAVISAPAFAQAQVPVVTTDPIHLTWEAGAITTNPDNAPTRFLIYFDDEHAEINKPIDVGLPSKQPDGTYAAVISLKTLGLLDGPHRITWRASNTAGVSLGTSLDFILKWITTGVVVVPAAPINPQIK